MKKGLKIFSCITAAVMLLSSLPLQAAAEESDFFHREKYAEGRVSYSVLDDGTAKISNFECYSSHFDIPATIDGYTVTKIGKDAFSMVGKLESVTIPDTVIEIEDFAFYYCKNLKSVKFGKNVKTIGEAAFNLCTSLSDAVLPDSVRTLGRTAFGSCVFETMVVPEGVKVLDDGQFLGCWKLKSIFFPKSLTSVAGGFNYCDNLTDVYYAGTKSQWENVFGGKSFSSDRTMHYNASYKPSVSKIVAGTNKVALKWNGVMGAEKYAIYTYYGGKFRLYKNTTRTSYSVTGLKAGQKYGFLVRAYANGKWSSYTTKDIVYATPMGSKPVITAAVSGTNKVAISWTGVENATKYAIYTYLNGKYSFYKNTTRTSYSVSGLSAGKRYGFLVKAYVNGKWTSYSAADLKYAYPLGVKPVITAATAAANKVTLRWTGVEGASGYAVYTYQNGAYTLYKRTKATSCNITGLTNGKKYGFLVRAYVNGKWTSYKASDLAYATPKA